jgi:hypothetical protein
MDRLVGIGSPLPPWQANMPASREIDASPYASWALQTESNPIVSFDAVNREDPARAQDLMLHFMSHINAECFISLLQVMDPMPDDFRARAEYKRFYHQLREVLTIPLPPPDPQPLGLTGDPLK